jgi:choline kinase
MDAVILAAGKNERLKGLVAPYHKPLLVVEGKPLVLRVMESCKRFVDRIILVVAPENAHAMASLVGSWGMSHRLHIVVQPVPLGPGEALYRGLCVSDSIETLVVCGDNIVPAADMEKFNYPQCSRIGVGVKITESDEEAQRFSRLDVNTWQFIEDRPGGKTADGRYLCWLGPIRVPTRPTQNVLEQAIKMQVKRREIKIAENLNRLNWEVVPIEVSCVDVGIPTVLEDVS